MNSNATFAHRLQTLEGAKLIAELALKDVNAAKSIAMLCYAASVASRSSDVFSQAMEDAVLAFRKHCAERALYCKTHLRGTSVVASPQSLVLAWARHLAYSVAQNEAFDGFDGPGADMDPAAIAEYEKSIILLQILLDDDAIVDRDKCKMFQLKSRLDVHVQELREEIQRREASS